MENSIPRPIGEPEVLCRGRISEIVTQRMQVGNKEKRIITSLLRKFNSRNNSTQEISEMGFSAALNTGENTCHTTTKKTKCCIQKGFGTIMKLIAGIIRYFCES